MNFYMHVIRLPASFLVKMAEREDVPMCASTLITLEIKVRKG